MTDRGDAGVVRAVLADTDSEDGRNLGLMSEPVLHRRLFELAALGIVGIFGVLVWAHIVPADGGVDQNGYLVGGKQLARTGTMKLAPTDPDTGKLDPFQFVGLMWVGVDLGTDTERFYPKYPIGLPALVAGALLVGGEQYGIDLTFWINPLAMTLAVAATFLLARAMVGSFAGVVAAALMAASPVVLPLANNPNSHATSTCFVTWGMFLLVRFWQSGGAWRAMGAGLLVGYAYTIRYTEGLLVIPVLAVAILAIRPRQIRTWLESGLLVAWWLIPVLVLTCFNLKAMESWTGYDPTNESLGFSWEYFIGDEDFAGNWETMLRHLNDWGLFFVFPLGIVGLMWMWAANWRAALVLSLWIVPNCGIYAIYYWAPDSGDARVMTLGYLRFFLTVFPAFLVAALWLLLHLRYLVVPEVMPTLGIGAIAAASVLVSFRIAEVPLESYHRAELFLQRTGAEILGRDGARAMIPRGSLVFSHDHLLHYLQFVGDFQLYSPQVFSEATLRQRVKDEMPDVHPLHKQRTQAIVDRLDEKFTQQELTRAQRAIIDSAVGHGRQVFFIYSVPTARYALTPQQSLANSMASLLPGGGATAIQSAYELKVRARWSNDQNTPSRKQQPNPHVARKRRPSPPPAPQNLQHWVLVELLRKPPA